jgi:hypothetical protein
MLKRRTLICNFIGKQMQIIYPASASINAMGMSDLFAVLFIAPKKSVYITFGRFNPGGKRKPYRCHRLTGKELKQKK